MSERKLQFKPSKNQQKMDKKSRVHVLKWSTVTLWGFDMTHDTCNICKNKLHDLCIDCESNLYSTQNKQCTRAIGSCNHVYHCHCIARWLKTKNTCPMDNSEWQ
eukprot:1014713_1